jgi:hypothetical protein
VAEASHSNRDASAGVTTRLLRGVDQFADTERKFLGVRDGFADRD